MPEYQGFTPKVAVAIGALGSFDFDELTPITLEWQEDESWSPRLQGSVTVAREPAIANRDVRTGLHMTITVEHLDVLTDAPSTSAALFVFVTASSPIIGSGTQRIEFASFDHVAHLAEVAFAYGAAGIVKGSLETTILPMYVNKSGKYWITLDWQVPAAMAWRHGNSTDNLASSTVAQILSTACELNDVQWYGDRLGSWVFAPRVTAVKATADVVLSTGKPTSTITAITPTVAFDDYANAVTVWYEDQAGTIPVVGAVEMTTGPYSTSVAPYVCRSYRRKGIPSNANAQIAAGSILRRVVTYGSGEEITAAAHLALQPGMTVGIELAPAAAYRRLVRSVAFRYPAAEMTVTTRNPA